MSEKLNRKFFNLGGFIVLTVVVTLFLTCDIGLGEIVNTKDPSISRPNRESPQDNYLRGSSNCIELEVGNTKADLSEVYMNVWYIDPETRQELQLPEPIYARKYPPTPPWCDDRLHTHIAGRWYAQLDTIKLGLPDGAIRVQITAKDKSGRETTTTDITYFVKNEPPQIELTIPKIKGEQFDDPELNYRLGNEDAFTAGMSIMGIATDSYGVAEGYPKILIWPDRSNRSYFNDDGTPRTGEDGRSLIELDSNDMPIENDLWQWRTVVNSNNVPLFHKNNEQITALQFRWPLYEVFKNDVADDPDPSKRSLILKDPLPVGKYNFIIKTKDGFDVPRENSYPDRIDKSPDAKGENVKFVQINIINPGNPQIRFVETHPDAHWTENGSVTNDNYEQGKMIGFPSLYNGKGAFGEHLIAKMRITGKLLHEIYIKISDSDNDEFISISDLSETNDIIDRLKNEKELYQRNYRVSHVSAQEYYVWISQEKVEEMLGSSSKLDQMLHVRAVDIEGLETTVSRQLTIDRGVPTLSIFDPSGMLSESTYPVVTSTVIMRGSALDNYMVEKMYYLLGVEETENPHLPAPVWNDNQYWTDTGLGCTPESHKHNNIDCPLTGPRDDHPNTNINSAWSGGLSSWTWTFHDIIDFLPENNPNKHYVREYIDKVTDKTINPRYPRTLYELPIRFKVIDKAQNIAIINASLILDPEADIPTIQINSHDTTLQTQTVGGIVYLNGIAADNEWINDVEMRITTDDSEPDEGEREYYSDFKSILTPSVNRGSTVSWSVDLNKKNKWKGEYTFEFRARDSYLSPQKEKPVRNHPREITKLTLIFDPNIPSVSAEIIQDGAAHASVPGISKMVKGNIQLKLTITDNEKIESVKIKTSAGTSWSTTDWSENYLDPINRPEGVTVTPDSPEHAAEYVITIPINTQSLTENQVFTIDIEAEDNTTPNRYRTQYSVALIPDNSQPVFDFVDPQEWKIGGVPEVTSTVTIRGSITDNQQVAALYYVMGTAEIASDLYNLDNWNNTRLDTNTPMDSHPGYTGTGNDGKITWAGSLSSWNVVIRDTADFFRTNAIRDQFLQRIGMSNKWELPIEFRAVDTAGNVTRIRRNLAIDPDADTPKITINSHSNTPGEGYPQTVGGKININGIAVDNERIHDVEIRISKKNASGEFEFTVPGYTLNPNGDHFISILSGTTRSSTVSWSHDLNAHNPSPDNPRWDGEYKIEIRARDSYLFTENSIYVTKAPRQNERDIEEIIFHFDPGVPEIEAWIKRAGFPVDTEVVPGISTQVKGSIFLDLTVSDNQKIESIKTKDSLTKTWSENYLTMTQSQLNERSTAILEKAPDRYVLRKTISTEALAGLGTNEVYTIDVEATDNTSPVAFTTVFSIALLPDNEHPVVQFTEPQSWSLNTTPEVSSTVTIRGTVTDNQRVSKLYYRMGNTDTSKGHGIENWQDTLLGTSIPASSYPVYTSTGDIGKITWAGALSSWNVVIRDTADFLRAAIRDDFVTKIGSTDEYLLPFEFMAVDEAGNQTIIPKSLIINPDLDIPRITINSPDHNVIQIVSSKVSINGLATDNEWIKDVEMRITKDNGSGTYLPDHSVGYENFTSILQAGASRGSTVSWSKELNPDSNWNGRYRIEILARDSYLFDQNVSGAMKAARGITGKDLQTIEFIFSDGYPVIKAEIIRDGFPDTTVTRGISTQVRGNIKIKLTITDDNGVTSIKTKNSIDTALSENYIPAATRPSGAAVTETAGGYIVEFDVGTASLPENLVYTIDVEASDNTQPALTSQFSIMLMPDNHGPTFDFVEPIEWNAAGNAAQTSAEVTSTTIIRGSIFDNQQVDKLYYALGHTEISDGTWNDSRLHETTKSTSHPQYPGTIAWDGSLSSWNVRFKDTAEFFLNNNARDRFLTQVGQTNKWQLLVRFKATDKAGNETLLERMLIIDPDADLPTIDISSHTEFKQTIGGDVSLSGIATDNESVHSVQIRITIQSDSAVDANRSLFTSTNGTDIVSASGDRDYLTGDNGSDYWVTLHPAGFVCNTAVNAIGCNGKHVAYTSPLSNVPVGRTGGQGTTVSWQYKIPQSQIVKVDGNREFLVEVRPIDASVIALGTMKSVNRPATSQGTVPIAKQRLNYASGAPSFPSLQIIKHTFPNGSFDESQYNTALSNGLVSAYQPGISMISGYVTFRAVIEDDGDITSIKMSGLWHANDNDKELLNKANVDGHPFVSKLGKVGTKERYALYIPVDTMLQPPDVSDLYSFTINVEDNLTPPLPGQQMISVTVDRKPPEINFIEPLQSPAQVPNVTSTTIIKGTLTDNQKVASMHYALGKVAAAAVKCTTPGTHDDFCSNTNCDGYGGLNVSPAWINTNLHTSSPLDSHTDSRIRAKWSRTLSSWEWRFDNIADVVQDTVRDQYVTETSAGSGLFELPISFKLTDVAGNFYVERITLLVDPNRDVPMIKISSHSNEQAVGGSTRMNGTAEDNEIIHRVQYRILMQGNDDCDTQTPPSYLYRAGEDPLANPVSGQGWTYVNIPSYGNAALVSASSWYPNDPPNYTSMVSWFININDDGKLTPPVDKKIRRVRIEIRAQDATIYTWNTPKDLGPVYSLYLNFDNSVPTIEDETIFYGLPSSIKDIVLRTHPAHGEGVDCPDGICEKFVSGTTRLKGSVTMRLVVRDETQIDSIRVRAGTLNEELLYSNTYGSELNDVNPWTVGIGQDFPVKDGDGHIIKYAYNEYYVFIPMATGTASGTKFGAGKVDVGEVVNLSVQVLDNTTPAPYMAQGNYPLEIDNRYPLATYTGSTFARGNQFEFAGDAWDTGSGVQVQGVERVVVYLTKGDGANQRVVNLHGTPNTTVNNPLSTPQKVRQGRVGNTTSVSNEGHDADLSYFPDVRQSNGTFRSTNQGIVIDNGTWADTFNTIGKSFSGSTFLKWSVNYDTTKLTDGIYQLNYVVFDKAENATHYLKRIYIANKAPVITGISLGTDINMNNAVGDDEYISLSSSSIGTKEITTGFRVRNNRFSLKIGTDETKGNGNKNYRIAYVNRSNATKAIVKGQVYTIANLGENINWTDYGVFTEHEVGTTFVATESVETLANTGSVWTYTHPAGAAYSAASANTATMQTRANGGHTTAAIDFAGTTAFGDQNSNLIKESEGIALDAQGNFIWNGKLATAADSDKRFFLIHVYDTTVSGGIAADQLSSVALINVGINNIDSFNPYMELSTFGNKFVLRSGAAPGNYLLRDNTALSDTEYNQNIVSTVTTPTIRKGYVQYRRHATNSDGTARNEANGAQRPDLSGMVIFKGKAMDNAQISRIDVTIGGTYTINNGVTNATTGIITAGATGTAPVHSGGQTIQIATLSNGVLVPAVAANTIAAMRAAGSTNVWGFETEEAELTMDYGHVVNWNFAWDTSNLTNLVGNNVPVTFTVTDTSSGTPATSRTVSQTIMVNIVPYITEINTQLSSAISSNPSSFNRSALGWYPVREDEVIEVRGFNLGRSTGTAVTPAVSVNAVGLINVSHAKDTSAGSRLNFTANRDIITATVDNNATVQINNVTSGALLVSVTASGNTVTSLNNRNSAAAHYNQEPNGVNNNILTDDRNMYVWNVGMMINENNLTSPVMRMSYNGKRNTILGIYQTSAGRLKIMEGNTGTTTAGIVSTTVATQAIGNQVNRFANISLAVSDVNGDGEWTAAYSNMTSPQANFAHTFNTIANKQIWESNSNAYSRIIMSLQNFGDPFCIKNPRMAVRRNSKTANLGTGNQAMSALVFYSPRETTTPLVLHYGFHAGTDAIGGNYPTSTGSANNNTHATASATGDRVIATNATSKAKSGQYAAVGILSNGKPVVAWYDSANQCLWFSYGDGNASFNTNVTGSAIAYTQTQFQNNAVRIMEGAGTHVDLQVDRNENIHLAYVDVRNGGLYYTFIPSTGTGANLVPNSKPANHGTSGTFPYPANSAVTTVRVDTYLSVGTKLMLNVRGQGTNNVPYITYIHNAFAETSNSIRVAWPKVSVGSATIKDGTNSDHTFTGDWEVMSVPAIYIPLTEEIVSSGVPTTNTNWAAPRAGITSTTTTNSVNPADTALRGFTTATAAQAFNATNVTSQIDKTILLGYMTDRWYEGAVLKYDIVGSLPSN